MGIMGRIKQTLDAIIALPSIGQAILSHVQAAVEQGAGPDPRTEQLMARMAELELGQERILAEAEAIYTRAESQLKSARSAEERARGMENRAKRLVESDEASIDPFERAGYDFQESNAARSEEEGMPDLRGSVGVPLNGKLAAQAAKWGR